MPRTRWPDVPRSASCSGTEPDPRTSTTSPRRKHDLTVRPLPRRRPRPPGAGLGLAPVGRGRRRRSPRPGSWWPPAPSTRRTSTRCTSARPRSPPSWATASHPARHQRGEGAHPPHGALVHPLRRADRLEGQPGDLRRRHRRRRGRPPHGPPGPSRRVHRRRQPRRARGGADPRRRARRPGREGLDPARWRLTPDPPPRRTRSPRRPASAGVPLRRHADSAPCRALVWTA